MRRRRRDVMQHAVAKNASMLPKANAVSGIGKPD
jgi:hypothetical protein